MQPLFIGGPAHWHPVPLKHRQHPIGYVLAVNVSEFTNDPVLRANGCTTWPIHDRAKPQPGDPYRYRVTVQAFYRLELTTDPNSVIRTPHFIFQGLTDAQAAQILREGIRTTCEDAP
jgi:hypothetical protein